MFSTKEILKNIDKTNIDNNLLKNNVKTNNVIKINKDKHRKIEVLAYDLTVKLRSPNSFKLFCQICYKNSEAIINRCLGITLEAKNVFNLGGYFVSLIKIYGEI